MRLEDQVCSLELAKRLKELGVKQEAAFHWRYSDLLEEWSLFRPTKDVTSSKPFYAAFTVAELGEMLPRTILFENYFYSFRVIRALDGKWWLSYETVNKLYKEILDDSEADARAKMIVYLIEQGIVAV